jgi:hypothetical protein
MIPDSESGQPPFGPPFRDADGCALWPGGQSWTSDGGWLGVDARHLHVPFWLGVVDQFEMAWDCHVLQTDYELEEEEKLLADLLHDPNVRELAGFLLERYPADHGELAVESLLEEAIGDARRSSLVWQQSDVTPVRSRFRRYPSGTRHPDGVGGRNEEHPIEGAVQVVAEPNERPRVVGPGVDSERPTVAVRTDDLHDSTPTLFNATADAPADGAPSSPNETRKRGPPGRGPERDPAVLSHPGAPSTQLPEERDAGEGIRTPAVLPDLQLRRPPLYRTEPPQHRGERGERDSNPRGPPGPAGHKPAAVTVLSHPRTPPYLNVYITSTYTLGYCIQNPPGVET